MARRRGKQKQGAVPGRRGGSGSVAKQAGIELQSGSVGILPVLGQLFERMRLREFLVSYLERPGRPPKVAHADAVLVLVRNILVSREPVYGVGAWAQEFAPDFLGLSEEQVLALNDDRVGRCLDRVFEADYRSLVLALVVHVVKEFGVNLDELHNDSTTVTFHGRYEGADAGLRHLGQQTLAITWGHNKDHRPDLKQLLFILTASRDGGVPIHFTAAAGNVSDDRTHRDTWDLLCEITGRRDFLYVADSKLASKENLAHIDQRGGRFVTVLPRTRREDRQFRQRLRRGRARWKPLLARQDEEGRVTDEVSVWDEALRSRDGHRLLWFHSTLKKRLDGEARQGRIQRGLQALSELRDRLASPRTRFRERDKVEREVAKILEESECANLLRVKVYEVDVSRFRQVAPGRPGPDTHYQRDVRKRFDMIFDVDEDHLEDVAADDGTFPLITNVQEFTAREAYEAYKRQPVIEKRFAQLKGDFIIAPVFLKTVWRIEGLLCVYFLAMLTQALLERELRQAMKRRGIASLPLYHEARDCKRPTTRRVIDAFGNVQRHQLKQRGKPAVVMVTELSPLQRRILQLLDVDSESYGHPR